MENELRFSTSSILLVVTNVALLFGLANLSSSGSSDTDTYDFLRLYFVFASIGFWRYKIAQKKTSRITATILRIWLLFSGAAAVWFFSAGLFGSSRTVMNFLTMTMFVFPITACSIALCDARGIWNTQVGFLGKIAIEAGILFPLWIFALVPAV